MLRSALPSCGNKFTERLGRKSSAYFRPPGDECCPVSERCGCGLPGDAVPDVVDLDHAGPVVAVAVLGRAVLDGAGLVGVAFDRDTSDRAAPAVADLDQRRAEWVGRKGSWAHPPVGVPPSMGPAPAPFKTNAGFPKIFGKEMGRCGVARHRIRLPASQNFPGQKGRRSETGLATHFPYPLSPHWIPLTAGRGLSGMAPTGRPILIIAVDPPTTAAVPVQGPCGGGWGCCCGPRRRYGCSAP